MQHHTIFLVDVTSYLFLAKYENYLFHLKVIMVYDFLYDKCKGQFVANFFLKKYIFF